MNLIELRKEIDKWISKGYDKKDIYIEGCPSQTEYEIDSIQKNTNPEIEPDYLFIMAGKEK